MKTIFLISFLFVIVTAIGDGGNGGHDGADDHTSLGSDDLDTLINGEYSYLQQIYSLSQLTNAGFGLTFSSPELELQFVQNVVLSTLNNQTIQEYLGNDWDVLWGPVVYSHNTCGTSIVIDNAMILFYSYSKNLFVVAIAGTNIDSVYGWLDEDFGVNNLVSWQSIVGSGVTVPSDAKISKGANTGLQVLLNMTDPQSNLTMLQWLNVLSSEIQNASVAVVGHSLGGALASCMALYMENTQHNWNSNGGVTTISALPTAGPTPGNVGFAGYYESLTNQNQNFTYNSTYNTLDIIPQAWQLSTMETVPTIYDQYWPEELPLPYNFTGPLVLTTMFRTLDPYYFPIEYNQVEPWTPLPGNFYSTICNEVISKLNTAKNFLHLFKSLGTYYPEMESYICYIAQLGWQHTTAYNELLNISQFASDYQWIKKQFSPNHQTEEELHFEALSRTLKLSKP